MSDEPNDHHAPHTLTPAVPPTAPSARKRVPSSDRLAAWVFGVYCAIALPAVVFGLGSYHWFMRDEWDFLAGRSLTNPSEMLRPYAEHWVTMPAVAYRLEWNVFGMQSYAPYQAATMIMHLATATLLRIVMRRAGVGPWIATAAASVFVLFGPGQQNMVWGFQVGMTGSIAFGLAQLVLSDHTGAFGRRDWLAVGAGLLGVMGSGVGVILVVAVGLIALVRRGWRIAALLTVPIAIPYAAWYLWSKDQRPPGFGAGGLGPTATWVRSGVFRTFEALGHYSVVGAVMAVLLLGGVGLAWAPLRGRALVLAVTGAPAALLVGALAFNVLTAISRGGFGAQFAVSSRYLHVTAALMLPALAVGADAVARRWKVAFPTILAIFLIPLPYNIAVMNGDNIAIFGPAYFDREKLLVPAMAASPFARQVPRTLVPFHDPFGGDKITVGWLVDADDAELVPHQELTDPSIDAEVKVRLGVNQTVAGNPSANCRIVTQSLDLAPRIGDEFTLTTKVNIAALNGANLASFPILFDPGNGRNLRIELPRLRLRLLPVAPATSFRICMP